MNPALARLYAIAQAPSRTILGLMSGTSIDGLDLALCRFEGYGTTTRCQVLHYQTCNYSPEVQALIQAVQSKTEVSLQALALLNVFLGQHYAQLICQTLQAWHIPPTQVDCIASHGQTIFHAPKHQHRLPNMPHATLQIGDGDQIAKHTQIITLSDFRQKHIAYGGEGAPLVLYGDYCLFNDKFEDRILLNIGGVANFTYLPTQSSVEKVLATDTGAGNALIDAFVQYHYPHLPFDCDGNIAASGTIHQPLLHALLAHPFLALAMPKTTGKEVFNTQWVEKCQIETNSLALSPANLIATLTYFSAKTIVECITKIVTNTKPCTIYVSGGGAKNKTLLRFITELLPYNCQIASFEHLGFSPQAKEAILFAFLANETLAGTGIAIPPLPAFTMGKISLPL